MIRELLKNLLRKKKEEETSFANYMVLELDGNMQLFKPNSSIFESEIYDLIEQTIGTSEDLMFMPIKSSSKYSDIGVIYANDPDQRSWNYSKALSSLAGGHQMFSKSKAVLIVDLALANHLFDFSGDIDLKDSEREIPNDEFCNLVMEWYTAYVNSSVTFDDLENKEEDKNPIISNSKKYRICGIHIIPGIDNFSIDQEEIDNFYEETLFQRFDIDSSYEDIKVYDSSSENPVPGCSSVHEDFGVYTILTDINQTSSFQVFFSPKQVNPRNSMKKDDKKRNLLYN